MAGAGSVAAPRCEGECVGEQQRRADTHGQGMEGTYVGKEKILVLILKILLRLY